MIQNLIYALIISMSNIHMYGSALQDKRVPIQAVRTLLNTQAVFLISLTSPTQTITYGVSQNNKEARSYIGTIDQFDPARWGSYNLLDGQLLISGFNPNGKTFQYSYSGKCVDRNGNPLRESAPVAPITTEYDAEFICGGDPKCAGYAALPGSTPRYIFYRTDENVDIGGGSNAADPGWTCKPKGSLGPCRTADGKFPPWKQINGTFSECATSCLSDPSCLGYAYDSSRKLCQQYGKDGVNPGTAAADATLTSSDHTQAIWACYVKGGGVMPPRTSGTSPAPAPAPAGSNDVWTNQGCWQDSAATRAIGPDFSNLKTVGASTVDECKTYAVSKGANVIGLQDGKCYYGKDSDYKKYGSVPAAQCKQSGDPLINNVWTLGSPNPTVPTPTAGPLSATIPTLTGPELKEDWQCVADFSAPVKRFGNDVGCLTSDGRTCLYEYCSNPNSKFPVNSSPLICGTDYLSKYGSTGYENPTGWCTRVNNQLPLGKPTSMPTSQISTVPQPVPQPFGTPYMALGEGLCRTRDGLYPAFEQRTVSEQECYQVCQTDANCMGYAYSKDGQCQLYNTTTAKVARTAQEGSTIDMADGLPSWKCNIKYPKVSIPITGSTGKLPHTPDLPQVQLQLQQYPQFQQQALAYGMPPQIQPQGQLPMAQPQVHRVGSLSAQLYNLPAAANCGSHFT